jgi:hypothetical protein
MEYQLKKGISLANFDEIGQQLELTSTYVGFEFCLPPACLLVFAELISSTLKMEAICSSETSVETQRITRRHIPEDDTLHNFNLRVVLINGLERATIQELRKSAYSMMSL